MRATTKPRQLSSIFISRLRWISMTPNGIQAKRAWDQVTRWEEW